MRRSFQNTFEFEIEPENHIPIQVYVTECYAMEMGESGPPQYFLKLHFELLKGVAAPVDDLELCATPEHRIGKIHYDRIFWGDGPPVEHEYHHLITDKLDELYGDDRGGWGFGGYN